MINEFVQVEFFEIFRPYVYVVAYLFGIGGKQLYKHVLTFLTNFAYNAYAVIEHYHAVYNGKNGSDTRIRLKKQYKQTYCREIFAVYSITDSSDYVTFSDGASGFAYNAVGFYTDDYTISSVGKIAKNITLNGGYIQGFLQGAYRLDVAFYPHGDNVSASDLAFMDGRITFAVSYGDKTVTPSVTYSASGESSVKTVASAGIDRDNFANLGINQTDDILLTITVKLDYASGGETYAKLYNYLLGGGAFVMDATVRLSEGGEA